MRNWYWGLGALALILTVFVISRYYSVKKEGGALTWQSLKPSNLYPSSASGTKHDPTSKLEGWGKRHSSDELLETAPPLKEELDAEDSWGLRGKWAWKETPAEIEDLENACSRLEYAGAGPHMRRVNKKDWRRVMRMFHGAKRKLLKWLEDQDDIDRTVASQMQRMVKKLRVQRPPTQHQPDLTWRGIGVWMKDKRGRPIVRMGGGFLKLARRNPARAEFELARLIAQSWTPCRLTKIGVSTPWKELIDCLGESNEEICVAGSYSTNAWAVSTSLAYAVAPPKCTVPALSTWKSRRCLKGKML